MKRNKKVVIGIIVVLVLIGVITLSYAFLSVGGKQELGNTFQSGCLNIRIDSESNAISLNNAKPVTDVEGLSTEGYTFTVKNTCSTSADFIINIENIDRQENSLNSDYLKVAINGEEFDNIVSILSSNITATPSVSNAYEAYTIYTGSIEGNTTRTFKIREWLDYDATKEQAASKVIKNKINVIAKSDVEVINKPTIKQNLKLTKMLGNITGTVGNAKYCVTESSVCTPNKEVTIENNKTSIELEIKDEKQVVCISLDNGTVMYGKMIESPKSFQVACTVTTQIIATVASNQYGGQSIDMIHLGKYLRVSYDKYKKELEEKHGKQLSKEMIEELVQERVKAELKAGIQTMQYQINTLMTTNGQSPFVTLFLHLEKDDPYIKENAMIIEEILNQRYEGVKNEVGVYVTPAFPKLVYVLDEFNNLKGGEYDYLTKLAVKCSAKRMYPDYISAKKMRENYEGNVFSPMGCRSFLSPWKDENGNYKFEGRFNQGVVSINLPQIGIIADGDEEKFWELLDERLELCKEALMCRHYALLGTRSDISPIHWQYGALARLKKGEKIDKIIQFLNYRIEYAISYFKLHF